MSCDALQTTLVHPQENTDTSLNGHMLLISIASLLFLSSWVFSSSVCPICSYVIANQLPLKHAEKSVNQTVFVCPTVIKIKSIVAVLPEVKRGINDSNKIDAVWHC